ncbi:MAG: NADH-quinone oxidoreductase subunit NuoK [Halobacteria archaeon]
MTVPLSAYLAVSAALFAIALYGVLAKRNGLVILMAIEIMLNGAALNFVAFSVHRGGDALGQIWALFAISLAAAEAAIGMAIYVVLFRSHRRMDLREVSILRW